MLKKYGKMWINVDNIDYIMEKDYFEFYGVYISGKRVILLQEKDIEDFIKFINEG